MKHAEPHVSDVESPWTMADHQERSAIESVKGLHAMLSDLSLPPTGVSMPEPNIIWMNYTCKNNIVISAATTTTHVKAMNILTQCEDGINDQ